MFNLIGALRFAGRKRGDYMIINFPRNALLWLLASISCVYLPLQFQLPLWTAIVFVSVVSWRWMMHLGRWPYPSKAMKVLVVILGIAAVIISARGQFSLESATSFILVAGLLKVLEIKTQRDGYIVLFLSYFLIAVNFLYDQGIFTALYGVLSIWILTSALISLHQTTFSEQDFIAQLKGASKTSAQVLALSVPIMLVLFLLFPRFGPLWSLNLQSNKAKTGLSEQMSPGDIAELSNSDELVFRVEFKDQIPAADQWYWRALVLDQYLLKQGKATWKNSGVNSHVYWYPQAWQPEPSQATFDYKIIQEETANKWLIGLRGVAAMETGIGMTEDDLIKSKTKLYQRKEYQVRSWPDMAIAQQGLRPQVRQQNVQLDNIGTGLSNPNARLFAADIKAAFTSDRERVEAVLSYYRQQEFSYTLQPQTMSKDDIDDFLFNKRAGFCAHYSSSFVFLMRAMGIPARVVAGYQGGELNADSGHITVRQYDAHAWVEVWFENEGWLSFDPTAQVAPDRINLGIRDALEEEFMADTNLSLLKLSHLPWLNDIRLQLDQLNYYWHQTVLNFNKKRQGNLLKQWFGKDALKQSLYWLAGLFCTFFALLAIIVLWQKPVARKTPLMKTLDKFNIKLGRIEMEKQAGEGLLDYSQRLQQSFPSHKKEIERLFNQVQIILYADKDVDQKRLIKHLNTLSRKLQNIKR